MFRVAVFGVGTAGSRNALGLEPDLWGEPRRVLDGEYGRLSFSVDGNFLLVDRYGVDGAPAVGKALVVPARGGDAVPVADGDVTCPAGGPEEHAIAHVEAPGSMLVSLGDRHPVVLTADGT